MPHKAIEDFLSEMHSINWFEHSGCPNENYYMVFSLYEACDKWGEQSFAVWESQICALEDIAIEKMGDDVIDEVFDTVSAAIGDIVWEKFGAYIDRQHLEEESAVSFELFDDIKRDIAWGCIEKILDISGFFTMLIEIYKKGYFPCSWVGIYHSGQVVVL